MKKIRLGEQQVLTFIISGMYSALALTAVLPELYFNEATLSSLIILSIALVLVAIFLIYQSMRPCTKDDIFMNGIRSMFAGSLMLVGLFFTLGTETAAERNIGFRIFLFVGLILLGSVMFISALSMETDRFKEK